jgi:hypothetical protein
VTRIGNLNSSQTLSLGAGAPRVDLAGQSGGAQSSGKQESAMATCTQKPSPYFSSRRMKSGQGQCQTRWPSGPTVNVARKSLGESVGTGRRIYTPTGRAMLYLWRDRSDLRCLAGGVTELSRVLGK